MSRKVNYPSSFLGKPIGKYDSGYLVESFVARPANTPNFVSQPKLKWNCWHGKMRPIFSTDRGTFWGPSIKSVNPLEVDDGTVSERDHETHLVEFYEGFQILNIVMADLENQNLVKPMDLICPIKVEAGDRLSFEFRMPYYIKGANRKHMRTRLKKKPKY